MLTRVAAALTGILCGFACYWAIRWTVADYVARNPSRPGLEYAVRLAPENPEYYVRLAQADRALAPARMQRAADLNPVSSAVWIEFARVAEEHNDFRGAERSLLRAVQVDKTFAPRWLLAEYYSRRRDEVHFWPAARAALAASYDDVEPLFDLCWAFSSEPRTILERAVPPRPDVVRQYFDFLLAKNRLDAAEAIAGDVMRDAGPGAVEPLLNYCDRLLQKNDASRAVEAWNALATKRLVRYPALAVAQGRSLTDGAFEKPMLGDGFDWRVGVVDGIYVQSADASSGIRFDFSGNQPESCELLTEWVPLEPARRYQLMVSYATNGLNGDTGLKWRALDVGTGADLLAASGRVTGNEDQGKPEPYEFSTTAGTRLVKLVLAYQRLPGTVRIEGWLSLADVALHFAP